MPTDRAMELLPCPFCGHRGYALTVQRRDEVVRCDNCRAEVWSPDGSVSIWQTRAPSPAVAEAERHGPGRCDRHKDEPGPSLYFDCCEVERLRELIKAREPAVAEAVEALEECVSSLDGLPVEAFREWQRNSVRRALTRARAALANLKP